MTKEELEKEVEDKGIEYADSLEYTISKFSDEEGYCWSQVEQAYEKGALDFAEPREKRIEELEKSCDETQELLDKQIEATCKLDKENAELKSECRRCVYTDSPCILSDYGKDKNGICDHFKDVFGEIVELNDHNQELLESCEGATMMYKDLQKANNNLNKAKELIKTLLLIADNKVSQLEFQLCVADAKQFLQESE